LTISAAVADALSTDSATTLAPTSARLPAASWKARSWALQYGHQLPPEDQHDTVAVAEVIRDRERCTAGLAQGQRWEGVSGVQQRHR
jgi:hypothetical protein